MDVSRFGSISDILSEIFILNPGQSVLHNSKNYHNGILCKNKATREKMRKLQVSGKNKTILYNKLDYLNYYIYLILWSTEKLTTRYTLYRNNENYANFRNTIFQGFGSFWCERFNRRFPTTEILNKVDICVLIRKQTHTSDV